jgi:hypothetical protein
LALNFKTFSRLISSAGDQLLDIATGPVGDIASSAFLPAGAQIVRDVAIRSYEGQAQEQATIQAEVAPPMAYYSQSTVSESGGTIDIPSSGPVYEGFAGALGQVGSNVITGLFRGLGSGGLGGAVGGAVTGYGLGQMMAGGDACGCQPKAFVRFNKCGQPIITRKMKKTLIDAVNNCGPEAAMQTYGLSPELMTMIISKQFPPRKMGISGAQLSTTMKTARKLDRAHKMMQNYCKKSPVRRTR